VATLESHLSRPHAAPVRAAAAPAPAKASGNGHSANVHSANVHGGVVTLHAGGHSDQDFKRF